MTDFKHVMKTLREDCEDESGPFRVVRANNLFVGLSLVAVCGGQAQSRSTVNATNATDVADIERGASIEGDADGAPCTRCGPCSKRRQHRTHTRVASSSVVEFDDEEDEESAYEDDFDNIWPLQLILAAIKTNGHMPPAATTRSAHQQWICVPRNHATSGAKLSSSGQDLGGDMLFGTKIGFSGASDLLQLNLVPASTTRN